MFPARSHSVWRTTAFNHLVRDEGVAGSNPATPTKLLSSSSDRCAAPAKPGTGAPGQISGQKRGFAGRAGNAVVCSNCGTPLNPRDTRCQQPRQPPPKARRQRRALADRLAPDEREPSRSGRTCVRGARVTSANGLTRKAVATVTRAETGSVDRATGATKGE